jgi:hypothetical protein
VDVDAGIGRYVWRKLGPGGPVATGLAQDGLRVHETAVAPSGKVSITTELWVDKWFRLYANGAPLVQDSVPYKTERSFNAERISLNADLSLTIAVLCCTNRPEIESFLLLDRVIPGVEFAAFQWP